MVATPIHQSVGMATPNKFSVSRPGLKHICMRAGGPFPLFHYKIGSFSSHYLPGTAKKAA